MKLKILEDYTCRGHICRTDQEYDSKEACPGTGLFFPKDSILEHVLITGNRDKGQLYVSQEIAKNVEMSFSIPENITEIL